MELIGLFVMTIVIMMAETILHYFPWKLILKGNDLPRPVAYIFGTLGFSLPLSAWLLFFEYPTCIYVVWIAIIAAGVTVLFLYLFDWVLRLIWKVMELEERENHAKKS